MAKSRREILVGAGWAGLGLGGLALSGCARLVPGAEATPPTLYRLTPKSRFEALPPPVSWQLLIDRPTASNGLDTPRIALQRAPLKLEYYARVGWTDRAPRMVQRLIAESFENSGAIEAVGLETTDLRSDYVLKVELREFQAEYFHGAMPRAHVRLNAKMVRSAQRAIIAGQSFEASAPASADRVEAVVEAFDAALGEALKTLVPWALRVGG